MDMQDVIVDHEWCKKLSEHPLLPGSILRYNMGEVRISPEAYAEKLGVYNRWCMSGIDATNDRDPPVCINFVEVLEFETDITLQLAVRFQVWKKAQEFIELVMEEATKDVVGYWVDCREKRVVLKVLASRTAYAILLTPTPEPGNQYEFPYDQLSDMTSELHAFVQKLKRDRAKEDSDPPYIGTIYMLDFLPKHLMIARAHFPRVRIVGITTPRPGDKDDKEIAAIIKTRDRMAAEKLAQEK